MGRSVPSLDIIGRYRLAEQLLTRKLFPFIGKPGQSSSPVGKELNAHANDCAKIILDLDLVSASVHEHGSITRLSLKHFRPPF